MRNKRKSISAPVGRRPEAEGLYSAIALALIRSPVTGDLSPRRSVDVITRSSSELGRLAKTLLRDALFEQRREAKPKSKSKSKSKAKAKK
jgi:hypothetical protein